MAEVEVFAAGGIVVDDAGSLLVVHRPRYDDWSFPKGKLDPGETMAECAVREVFEETGCVCTLDHPIVAVHYTDHKGRYKEVRYWRMTPNSVGFVPNDEVDEVRWLAPEATAELLSYPRDRDVLAALLDMWTCGCG